MSLQEKLAAKAIADSKTEQQKAVATVKPQIVSKGKLTLTRPKQVYDENHIATLQGYVWLYHERTKPVIMFDAVNSVKALLKHEVLFPLFASDDILYLDEVFTSLCIAAMEKARAGKDLDLNYLETLGLNQEEIEAVKTRNQSSSFSWSELKAQIDKAFQTELDKVLTTITFIMPKE